MDTLYSIDQFQLHTQVTCNAHANMRVQTLASAD